jgi:hypothetical protein
MATRKKTAPAAPPTAEASPGGVDARLIEILVDKNPRRPGTGRHALFEILLACNRAAVAHRQA